MKSCPYCSGFVKWEYNDEIPEQDIYEETMIGYCDCDEEFASWIELYECSEHMDPVYITGGTTLKEGLLRFKLQLKQKEIETLLKKLTKEFPPEEECYYGFDSKGNVGQFLAPYADAK